MTLAASREGATVAETGFDARVAAVRRFNRFYTKQIGLLHEGYLESPFSLSEVRVLYELAHREKPTAAPPGRANGVESRRAPEPSDADQAGAGRLRPAPGALARGHRREG